MQKKITGLHISGELSTERIDLLTNLLLIKGEALRLIEEAGFSCVGTADYSFPGNGFTLIIALAESHLSVHTWPELNYTTLDVFVCNLSKDNSAATRQLFQSIVELFHPSEIVQRETLR